MMVFLASKLAQPKQHQLAALAELLGGRVADTFSGSGSVCVVQKHLGGLNLLNVPGKDTLNTSRI